MRKPRDAASNQWKSYSPSQGSGRFAQRFLPIHYAAGSGRALASFLSFANARVTTALRGKSAALRGNLLIGGPDAGEVAENAFARTAHQFEFRRRPSTLARLISAARDRRPALNGGADFRRPQYRLKVRRFGISRNFR